MRKYILVIMFLACAIVACQNSVIVADLKCELLENPVAIDNTAPHFSWKMYCGRNGVSSTAYQILVATELDKLNETDADLWNTGKVTELNTITAGYHGKTLNSRSSAYWKVRVWDQDDKPSSWSEPAFFGVGLLNDQDWESSASFIGVVHPDDDTQYAPLLRKRFEYEQTDCRILLHVNSLGYHEAYVNGVPVSDAVLAPAVCQFGKRSQIVTYDVTSLVNEGANELVLWTGIGWYQTHSSAVIPGGPYVRAQLEAVSPKVSHTLLVTDGSWQFADSGRRTFGTWRPHQMGGEIVDSRIVPADLRPSTLDALEWNPVVVADIPSHKATPQMCELNRKVRSFHPISVKQDSDGYYIYDMGTNFVGFTEVKMPVLTAGEEIELHYDDCALTDSLGFRDGLYTDRYIADGGISGVFSSKFNYKGYRYLKLVGLKHPLPLSDITASPVRTDYSGNADFSCSDEDMNAIYDMVHGTLAALSLGGYIVDCPQIERLGYGGDGNASVVTAQTFFNLGPLYLNWMQAWSDCQRPDGGMPHTAPNPYTAGGGPYWCGFVIPASWQTYLNYGDVRLMERYYPVMQKWLEYAESYHVDGLLKQWPNTEYRGWYLGDWVPPMGVNPQDPRSIDLVNNCFLSDCYSMMERIAEVLGEDDDIPGYQFKRHALNNLIHETFYNQNDNLYASGSQIDQIYPMLVGATPDHLLDAVRGRLKEDTAERYNGHIATGLVGVSVMTQWATRNSEVEFIYGMLKKRTYPGYLYMIDNGATLTWEEWDGERSQLHNCYNAIGSWFIQALAGIRPDESAPGYSHFFVQPQLVEGINWVEASKDTPYGKIEVFWKVRKEQFTIKVRVPSGAAATVCMPDGREVELASGTYEMQGEYIP